LDVGFRDANGEHREDNPMTSIETASEKRSLYDRLGGVYSIATVVDDFIDRIMVDPRLNANPRVDEAHHKVPPAGFKYLVTEMLCWAAGGPQRYTGRDMETSHRHLAITESEWEAFMDDLQTTLDKFSVPAAEQAEVRALVESTHAALVVPAAEIAARLAEVQVAAALRP
jgi:hemoglobin